MEKQRKTICYHYDDTKHFKEYATNDIKRFQQVFIYLVVTLVLIGCSVLLSLIGILLSKSKQKNILKYSSLASCFCAGISGMVGILVTRIERQSEQHQRTEGVWTFGDSFVFLCTGEAFIVLLILYNCLLYFIHSRRTIQHQQQQQQQQQQQSPYRHQTHKDQISEECFPMMSRDF